VTASLAQLLPQNLNPEQLVYEDAPRYIFWELTRACDLACLHCRAEAQREPLPGELDLAEVLSVVSDIADFEPVPHLVLTGGDPLKRRDLFTIIDAARNRGVGVSLAPAVSDRLDRAVLERLAGSGVRLISVSLDWPDAARHDALRRSAGCFERTFATIGAAQSAGLGVQVNSLVTAASAESMPQMYELLLPLGIVRWSLFFLINVGRGSLLEEIRPGPAERLLRWLYTRAKEAPFQIKTTEAMHYRRVVLTRMQAEGSRLLEQRPAIAAAFGIRDGNGIVFINHDGEVYPSGFLPLSAGNVRSRSLVEIYRHSPVLTALRNIANLKGHCGRCEFAPVCGGSRARAYAATGDPFAADPLCPYRPAEGVSSRRQES
jgi:radical SAM protein